MKAKTWAVVGLAAAAGIALWRRRPGLSLRDQVVVITGGSRGLGLALAREFGAQGATLVLIARDGAELDRAADELRGRGYPVTVWPFDLLQAEGIEGLTAKILDLHGRIDVLVNNAGEIVVGPFETLAPDDFERSLALHLMAPFRMIRAILPGMKSRGGGRIVNISSIGGKIPVPHLSAYCAGKFALVGLSATLRAELSRDAIAVTTVCPGLMRTGSHWNAFFKGRSEKEFAWFAHGASLPGASMNAERAARQIVAACRRGDAELVISLPAQVAVVAQAVAPGLLAAAESFVHRLLPRSPAEGGHDPRTGWESRSRWVPSILTRLGDGAAVRNNELRGHLPPGPVSGPRP